MTLNNPACIKAGYCIRGCGMCHLKEGERRLINEESLFGECRALGKCICGHCDGINGKRKMFKGTIEVSAEEVSDMMGTMQRMNHEEAEFNRKNKDSEIKYYSQLKGVYKCKEYSYKEDHFNMQELWNIQKEIQHA